MPPAPAVSTLPSARRTIGAGWPPTATVSRVVAAERSRCATAIVQKREEPSRSIASLTQRRIAAGECVLGRRGADRVARQRRHRRGLRALAADVADDREPVVLGRREEVVEVAADLVLLARRPVQRAGLDARDLRQQRRQQRGLQRLGDLGAGAVEAGVLDRGGRAQREVLGEPQVGVGEAPPRLRADERDHAEDAVAHAHRDHHRRGHAERPGSAAGARRPARPRRSARPGCRARAPTRPSAARGGRRGRRAGRRDSAPRSPAAHLTFAGSKCATATRSSSPAASPSRSTAHQSAMTGHRELRDRGQRGLVLERVGERAARLGQEALRLLDLLELGDVLDDVDGEPYGPVGVADGLGLDARPAPLAALAVDELHQHGPPAPRPSSARRPGSSASACGSPSGVSSTQRAMICAIGAASSASADGKPSTRTAASFA